MAICFRITGDPMRAGMVGAMIARYCGGENCVIVPQDRSVVNANRAVLMRPDYLRFHAELQIDPAQISRLDDARPVYAYRPIEARAAPLIPFSPFGQSAQGVEFHQLWLRADEVKTQPPLETFSTAIALADRDAAEPARQLNLASGIECSRVSYAQLLLGQARRLGARVESELDSRHSDIVIDCDASEEAGAVAWDENRITVAPAAILAGEEWQAVLNAARRIVAMVASPADALAERQEFNRLSTASAERMADFRALVTEEDPRKSERPALQRKIEVFEACGRIPTEDYEVFAPFEWLAALWAQGIRPHRHERLAERMPEADLLNWMGNAYAQAQSTLLRGAAL
ncbi:tryptophan 7-halogenase [Qipengyuania sp. DGS5-3]|uniref:tryptophan 7-halogenase n=1 Tax=Qipengyuania sp. DGS5-3 TaxID=3349632 RepID=UPI0036D294E4